MRESTPSRSSLAWLLDGLDIERPSIEPDQGIEPPELYRAKGKV
jgi:hypothetical protein